MTTSDPATVDPAPRAEAAIRQLCDLLLSCHRLTEAARSGAVERNPEELVAAMEVLLPMHVECARLYRTWLAAHSSPVIGRPRLHPPGPGSMSV